ncbi:hypothetical protein H6G74_28825 [Nostoc spongiaeforme FACHB-130]|uniref:Uncharacterized protein n=1 Tax=Nostoc spongiaeforme FACHB-130 TaxID=1357510 RepID=A0ABR8G595_9NOSO|nr:hypothetical protein [Nostoc spongiaeforme]MBD2598300.1 hypothetical protein [Nostoc spongiaeforme FACHB-130]
MNYESRRITISYLAVIELCQMFDIPQDAPTQALSAAIEKLIFQGGIGIQTPLKTQNSPSTSTAIQPNKAGLATMASQFKGVAS